MADGVELGVGYLSLAASTGQFGKDVKAALKGVDVETSKAAKSAGQSWTSKVGGAATKAVKGLGVSVAGVATLLGGMALKGGVERALKIEGAQAKLRGLGHDTKSVDQIMKNALASVKGTAFGLGEAATTAAGAVAAGIKPGEGLEKVLKSVANSAAAAGVGMDEMGGIYNKVASLGKAQNDVLQQVADKGIPIYQALGKQMGMTAEQVFKAASEGKIGFQDFQAAMTSASGTVAEEMGKTLPGKIDNFKAALSRLGEKAVANVLPYIADGVQWLTDKFDSWGPAIAVVGEKVGEWLGRMAKGVKGLVDLLVKGDFTKALREAFGLEEDSPVVGFLLSLRDTAIFVFDEIKGGIRAFGAAWEANDGDVTSSGFPGLMERIAYGIRQVVEWVRRDLIPSFVDFGGWAVKNKDWLLAMGVAIATAVGVVKTWVAITKIAKAVQLAWNVVMSANPIGVIIVAIAALVAGLVYFFTQTETGKKVWESFTKGLVAAWEWVAAKAVQIWNAVAGFFTGLWDSITSTVGGAIQAVSDTITGVTTAIKTAWENTWNAVGNFFSALWASIKKVVSDQINAVKSVIDTVSLAIKLAWETTWNGIRNFFSALWAAIKKLVTDHINAVKSVIDTVVGGIKRAWDSSWNAIKTAASTIWAAIKQVISDHINAVKKVISDVTGAISGVWDRAWGGIKDIGSKAWNWIKDTALGVFDRLRSGVESTFGKMRDALSTIWDAIKGVFARPINAVIRFINDGIIGGYNSVAKVFKMSEIGRIKPLPGYHDGGFTGPGGKYDPAGIVHAGEWVLTKEQVAQMGGPRGVESWLTHGLSVPGYAGGGLVSYQGKTFTARFAAALRNAASLFGSGFHISQGGFRPATSYSGTSHQGDAVDITSPVSQALIVALRKSGIAAWDRTGKGNWAPHIHGVPLPGYGSAGGSAIWQAQDYLRGGDGLGGRDNGPGVAAQKGFLEAIAAGFDSVKSWFSGVLDQVAGPFRALSGSGGGMLGDLVVGIGAKLKDELTAWVKSTLGIGAATGTMSASRGPLLVGERGPEYLWARGGEAVIPATSVDGSSSSGVTYHIEQVSIAAPDWVRDVEQMKAWFETVNLAFHRA